MVATINETTLETTIKKAVIKINAKKESQLCRYLPVSTGGYMHHFTFKKMKHEDAQTLENMILENVVNVGTPSMVVHKPRAPRGSRKRFNQFQFDKNDLDRLIGMARTAGHSDLISKLMPKRSLAQIKKDLVKSIRKNEINQDLWNYYTDAVAEKNPNYDTGDVASADFLAENQEFANLLNSLKR